MSRVSARSMRTSTPRTCWRTSTIASRPSAKHGLRRRASAWARRAELEDGGAAGGEVVVDDVEAGAGDVEPVAPAVDGGQRVLGEAAGLVAAAPTAGRR